MKKSLIGFIIFVFVLLSGYQLIQWKYYSELSYGYNIFVQLTPDSIPTVLNTDTNTIRILCLGGSTTHNFDLDRENQYPAILKTLLEDSLPNVNIEMVNGGYDWYTTKHSLINYTSYYNSFEPDYVIIMHAINDICRSFTPQGLALGNYKEDYTHFYGPGYDVANPPMLEKHILKTFLGVQKYEDFTSDLKMEEMALDQFLSLESYKENYDNLIRYVKSDGGKCYVVEQASSYQEVNPDSLNYYFWFGRALCNNYGGAYPSNNSLYHAMKLYNQEAKKIANEYNVEFIETSHILYPDTTYFNDDVHYTPLGKQTLSNIVFNHLIHDIQVN